MELRLSAVDLALLRASLLGGEQERCAVLFAGSSGAGASREFLVVREVVVAEEKDYLSADAYNATLSPLMVAKVAKAAKRGNFSLVFVHSHLGGERPCFSAVDDQGEVELALFLERRTVSGPHAALVVSAGGVSARRLGTHQPIRVVSIGDRMLIEGDEAHPMSESGAAYDRQVRAFGAVGQRAIGGLSVAIVGLGGTGSLAAQALAHLGVRDFVLVDPDVIEASNLNRVVEASTGDIGSPKVEVARRYIERVARDARVRSVVGDVMHSRVAEELLGSDLIFCCTDSHGSRSVVQQVAYQYFIPTLDMGSTITTAGGAVTGVFGRVQMLGPGQPCLWCCGLINSEQVRRDMMTAFERQADPYVQGVTEPAPSVISLNATVVSLATTMLLGIVTPVPTQPRYMIYNALSGSLRAVRGSPKEDCFICSTRGVLGRASGQPLFARTD